MSPELCSGGEYSGQLADVWALGATMYMIRCGKPPFMANQVLCYGTVVLHSTPYNTHVRLLLL